MHKRGVVLSDGCVLHQIETRVILNGRLERPILLGSADARDIEQLLGGDHTLFKVGEVGTVILSELLAEIRFTEVARVVPNNVLNDLNALGVSRVDQILICKIGAFISFIDRRKIKSVVAVVIVTRSVLNYGSNPDSGKAERLYIVELIRETLEITAPRGVGVGVLGDTVVPAMDVVLLITVIETCGNHKIDGLLTEIDLVSLNFFIRV